MSVSFPDSGPIAAAAAANVRKAVFEKYLESPNAIFRGYASDLESDDDAGESRSVAKYFGQGPHASIKARNNVI